jgi:hypothetical protein
MIHFYPIEMLEDDEGQTTTTSPGEEGKMCESLALQNLKTNDSRPRILRFDR